MAAFYFYNLSFFYIQYIIATIVALSLYIFSGRLNRLLAPIKPVLRPYISHGEGDFKTPLKYEQHMPHNFILMPKAGRFTGNVLSSPLFGKDWPLLFWPLTAYSWCFFNPKLHRISSERSLKMGFYENPNIYAVYRIFLSIIVWAGILFLITPYRYVYVFIPHLSPTLDIIVAVVISVSIFEAAVSFVYFAAGTGRRVIAVVEITIAVLFTMSLVAPSMSWFYLYSITGRLIIYITLILLFLAIGFIIPLLRSTDSIFKTSFGFSLIAYASIIMVVMINIIAFLK